MIYRKESFYVLIGFDYLSLTSTRPGLHLFIMISLSLITSMSDLLLINCMIFKLFNLLYLVIFKQYLSLGYTQAYQLTFSLLESFDIRI